MIEIKYYSNDDSRDYIKINWYNYNYGRIKDILSYDSAFESIKQIISISKMFYDNRIEISKKLFDLKKELTIKRDKELNKQKEIKNIL